MVLRAVQRVCEEIVLVPAHSSVVDVALLPHRREVDEAVDAVALRDGVRRNRQLGEVAPLLEVLVERRKRLMQV